MNKNLTNKNYDNVLKNIITDIKTAKFQTVRAVNKNLIILYWNIGKRIADEQIIQNYGKSVVEKLSKDLRQEFPNATGFSARNLWDMKRFYDFYNGNSILRQLVAELPWGHNLVILNKIKDVKETEFYLKKAIQFGWSRVVLVHQIENQLYERQGKSITNFKKALPDINSDLAQQTFKDPYIFDFLNIQEEKREKNLEDQLVKNITKFLLELGTGFSFIGRQYHIAVSTEDFYIDLLFYNIELHCYVVIELKTTKFEPGFAGQLNFYVTAVDRQLRKKGDNPTIGLLLCKSKDNLIVEYSLSDIHKPIGVSEYKFKKIMPTKKQLENIVNLEDK
jgi:predicted nuclease of restriction endonuclease-like (RecB) superfamily